MRQLLATLTPDADRRVLTVAIARMAESVGNSFLVTVLPLYIASETVRGDFFGLPEVAVTGVILSLFGFVNSPLQPFTGRLSDRTGKRKAFILFGLVLLATASLAYTVADTYVELVAFRMLQGLAGAFIIPTSVALINDYATAATRGGNMGTYNTVFLAGFGLGPVVAGAMMTGAPYSFAVGPYAVVLRGFEAAFYFATCTALVSFLLVALLVHDPDDLRPTGRGDVGGFAVFAPGSRTLDPTLAIGVATFFVAVAIALFATLHDIVNARLDQTSTMFGVQFSAFILAQLVVQIPAGRASDRYGRRPFLLLGLALTVPSTVAQGVILDSWLMVVARFVQGVGGALVFVIGLSMAGDLAREGESGASLSVVTVGFMLGVAVGPLVSGFLVAYGFVVPFAFGTVLAAAGLVLVYTQVPETAGPPGAGAESGAGAGGSERI